MSPKPLKTNQKLTKHRSTLAQAIARISGVACLALVGQANALSLGKLNVSSYLGQPLNAEIEVALDSGETTETTRAKIASPELYQSQGLEYTGILSQFRVSVIERANKTLIRITSAAPVQEAFINLLVDVNSSTGRIVRDYVFLLDPPGAGTAQVLAPQSAPAAVIIPVLPATAAATPSATTITAEPTTTAPVTLLTSAPESNNTVASASPQTGKRETG
ncbi:MAG: hypothetical protein RLZZ502_1836, partial [Pseudomonadota bacterium]